MSRRPYWIACNGNLWRAKSGDREEASEQAREIAGETRRTAHLYVEGNPMPIKTFKVAVAS